MCFNSWKTKHKERSLQQLDPAWPTAILQVQSVENLGEGHIVLFFRAGGPAEALPLRTWRWSYFLIYGAWFAFTRRGSRRRLLQCQRIPVFLLFTCVLKRAELPRQADSVSSRAWIVFRSPSQCFSSVSQPELAPVDCARVRRPHSWKSVDVAAFWDCCSHLSSLLSWMRDNDVRVSRF